MLNHGTTQDGRGTDPAFPAVPAAVLVALPPGWIS
jgi:hypothetical protein